MDKVYIILVNYNTSEHTVECIKSINQNPYKEYSIIVVDNASTDKSVTVLKKSGLEFVLIESSENLGFAGGNNLGIDYALQKSDCSFVWLLNNDTVIDSMCLIRMLAYYHDHKEEKIGIVSGKILYYSDKDAIWYAGGRLNDLKGDADTRGYNEKNRNYKSDCQQTFASGCCMLIPYEIIRGIKLQEHYFLYYEDVDYCKKIIKNNYRIAYVEEAVIYHKVSMATDVSSFSYSYYFTRNRLIYIQENIEGIKKLCSYFYSLLWVLKKIICNQFNKEAVALGIKDFRNNITGKLRNTKKE